jgi:uncharacterized protein
MQTFKKYFFWSTVFAVICLIIGFIVGYMGSGTIVWGLSTMFIVAVLGLLETSISFDNAIVNVNVLKNMDATRQRRFLTRWMIIAVFGMRVLFPILLVAIFAKINPLSALQLAIYNPVAYGQVLSDSHVVIAGFGGAFLMMVWLKFFFNKEKSIHWLQKLEKWMTKLGQMEAIEAAVVLITLEGFSYFIDPAHAHEFFVAGVWWVVLYILINGIESFFGHGEHGAEVVAKSWLASFLYLEVLDASFSLDGVIGAFALSNNLLIIAAGLGIGAFFVRSFTVYMLKAGTLQSYRYLEHGAFYAVIALAIMMLIGSIIHLPEIVIWGIWLICISWSLYSSWKANQH